MTGIPQVRVGYEMTDQANEACSAELAVIIYLTSAKGIVFFYFIEVREMLVDLANLTLHHWPSCIHSANKTTGFLPRSSTIVTIHFRNEIGLKSPFLRLRPNYFFDYYPGHRDISSVSIT